MDFDKEKFKRLVHYVAWKAGTHDWFGAVKLNKVLWFADARVYMLTGASITGEAYTRGPYGPVPRHIEAAEKELLHEGAIQIRKESKLTRVTALRPAKANWFSSDELMSIDYWIKHIDEEHTAKSISDKSHDYVWEIANMGEELPLYAYRVARIQEPEPTDIERLKKRAKELGIA
jgi:hypothetical protein